jgi:RimJ/RimL family protein N-acetyltransferase
MSRDPFSLDTPRLRLRSWRESDRSDFAAMNADVEVMADLGGPLSRVESDRKLDRFSSVFEDVGYTRWVIEGPNGSFAGYAGIVPVVDVHPLGEHHDFGWRLVRSAWGHGFASEAARACLADAFDRVGLLRVFAYTSADNTRSISVMSRLGLTRNAELDFTKWYDGYGNWSGLVWSASTPGVRGSSSNQITSTTTSRP